MSNSPRIAAFAGTRLLVLDPVITAASGARDGNQSGDVRKSLAPYIRLAEDTGACVVGISHFAKGSRERPALERLYGSGAWGQKARLVLYCTKIVNSEDRALIRIKSNIGASGGGYRYAIDGASLPNPEADEPEQPATIQIPRASFIGGYIDGKGDELLRGFTQEESDPEERSRIEEAMDLLETERGTHPHIAAKTALLAARANGITDRTMQRARDRLGWRAQKIGTAWHWVER